MQGLTLGIAIVVVSALIAGPASALPNKKVDVIRGFGSDATVDVMQNLDRAFNNTIGCFVVTQDSASTSQLDLSCNPSTAGPPFGPENWDHDVGLSYFAVGSGNGVNQLLHQGEAGVAKIDYARSSSSRGSTPAQARFVAFAKDAIPWVNFRTGTAAEEAGPAAGVDSMSKTNLQDIFTNCTITTWSDTDLIDPGTHLGQPDDVIIVWASQAGSGTTKTFESSSMLGGSSSNCIPAEFKDADLSNGGSRVIFENDPTPIRDCATDPDGAGSGLPACPAGGDVRSIYYMGFGAYQAFPVHPTFGKAVGADLGAIGSTNPGVAPTPTTISNGTFIFNRNVFNVYRNTFPSNNIAPAALDYIGEKGWICKGTAAEVTAGTDSDNRGGHVTNPKTGANYADEVAAIIAGTGFVPLLFDNIAGGVTGKSRCRVF